MTHEERVETFNNSKEWTLAFCRSIKEVGLSQSDISAAGLRALWDRTKYAKDGRLNQTYLKGEIRKEVVGDSKSFSRWQAERFMAVKKIGGEAVNMAEAVAANGPPIEIQSHHWATSYNSTLSTESEIPDGMPESIREIFSMRLDGFKMREISRSLGLTHRTVHERFSKYLERNMHHFKFCLDT